MGLGDFVKGAVGIAQGLGTDPERGWDEVSDAAVGGYRGAWNSDVGKFVNKWTGIADINRDVGDIINSRGDYADQGGGWLEKIWNGAASSLDNNWLTNQEIKKKLNWTLRAGGLLDNGSTIADLGTNIVGGAYGPGLGAGIGALTSWANNDDYKTAINRTGSGAVSGVLGNYLGGSGTATSATTGAGAGTTGSGLTTGALESSLMSDTAGQAALDAMGGAAGGTAAGSAGGSAAGAAPGYAEEGPGYYGGMEDSGVSYGDTSGMIADAGTGLGGDSYDFGGNGMNYGDAGGMNMYDAPAGYAEGGSGYYGGMEDVAQPGGSWMDSLNGTLGKMNRRDVLRGINLAKTGLSAYQNNQQQSIYRNDMEARNRALSQIGAMEKNPMLIYKNDPGLAALRQNAARGARTAYAAKYGGTAGSEAQTARALSQFDRMALNEAIDRRYRMMGATQGAQPGLSAYGGTTGGGIAAAGVSGMGDYLNTDTLNAVLDYYRQQQKQRGV